MTTLCFHTTVSSDGTVTLPPEFCGKSVRIAVEKEPVQWAARIGCHVSRIFSPPLYRTPKSGYNVAEYLFR